ncbi:MAG TPA: 3-carboxy-cis,cis-muconate cycloisomerase [Burkholderiales bacterium]
MTGLARIFEDAPSAEAFSDAAFLAAMLAFEGALARACAAAGLVSGEDASAIARVCAGAQFDVGALAQAARESGALPIPFVRELTAQVAAVSPAAARQVHLGATSQDVIDTASVLCLRAAGERLLALTDRLGDALSERAHAHAATPMLARTLLQPAVPVPFGWKVAGWLAGLARARGACAQALGAACVLQFGGAGGTLAAYGAQGEAVAQALAADLGLPRAPVSWHAMRDGFARAGAELAILTGVVGKVARDVALMMQAEVGEAFEPLAPGRGGSSAMPHKRNPAACLLALEAAGRVPGLAATLIGQLASEHERGLGQWQRQWLLLGELAAACGSALEAMAGVIEGLQVDADAMRRNIDRTNGLVYSEQLAVRLAPRLGKPAAHALVEALCAEAVAGNRPLHAVATGSAQVREVFDAAGLAQVFEPTEAFGSAGAMIERARAAWAQVRRAPSWTE